ncbi:Hypothetical protein Y17_0259 [Pectobacterium wasabiae CFBP 3304]|nr:Hypothetical protein Y17_0259 [Pectobacterium wasabiae CFBP 3304]KFX09777.1 hypothetical protein JV38_02305 [Pectobacterium wasabiae]
MSISSIISLIYIHMNYTPIIFKKEMILFGAIVQSGLKVDEQDDARVKVGTGSIKKTKALAIKERAGEGVTSSYIAVISDELTG